MNISEANAASRLLSWVTGRDNTTAAEALADAEFLAARSVKALHAGITPDQVRASWPTDPPKEAN